METWYDSGLLSRVDGPALRWQDGTDEWFYRNQRHRIGLPAVIGSDGLREWHQARPDQLSVDLEWDTSFTRLQGNENYFREHGPAVTLGNGTRYWGNSSVGGYFHQRPTFGPWIEYGDGSIDFVEDGYTRNREAGHPSTVALREAGRRYVTSVMDHKSGLMFSGVPFFTLVEDATLLETTWRLAGLDDRRRYAAWVIENWERVRGNLSHDDDRAVDRWLGRFENTVSAEREELRILRENMQGYLRVALRRLEGVVEPDLASLQDVIESVGLPLTGAVAQLTPESRLLRAVVTAPSVGEAIGEELLPRPTLTGKPVASTKARSSKVINELYVSGLAELALGALATIVECNGIELADTILLNVMVDEVDMSTGRDKRYCVVSIQVEREEFEALNLDRVDPLECVRGLNAVVPRGNTELAPVRPIIAFDKEDARIIAAVDVASRLDSRANLMELTPNEFESLIQNLFTKIGLDTHQTQASLDGGVDAIAYDSRPIFGGKIIIQAKRYKNTVGVSAVRDLYGTVLNEGASKGLLVTTSGYGKSSFEFAKNKPLELLEGGHLLHLLKEHLDMDAVIVPPVTWVDPMEDAARA